MSITLIAIYAGFYFGVYLLAAGVHALLEKIRMRHFKKVAHICAQ